MITVVIYQDNFAYQVLGTAIEDTHNGSQQSGPRLVVEGNDDTRLGEIFAVFLGPAPDLVNSDPILNMFYSKLYSLKPTWDFWCLVYPDCWAEHRWPPD